MEMDEDVYANMDDLWMTEVKEVGEKTTRRGNTDLEAAGYQVLYKRPQLPEGKAVENLKTDRKFGRGFFVNRKCELGRLAMPCLGLLCVLLLAMVTGLSLFYLKNSHQSTQLQISSDSLQSQYDLLRTERDQLQNSFDSLQSQYDLLRTERDQLQISSDSLQSQYDLLRTERDQLQISSDSLGTEKCIMQSCTMLERSEGCCPGWKKFQSSCYYLSTEEKTWIESNQYCRNRGSNLVIIKSNEEQMFLNELRFREKFWIGLTDAEQEGVWKWVDGTKPINAFWKLGEPNNSGMREHCAVFNQIKRFILDLRLYSWNDEPCEELYRWVCKTPVVTQS